MPLSYLAVLKNSLFSSGVQNQTPNVPNQTIDDKNDLKDNWVYVHDDDNSQTEEMLDLNEHSEFSFANCSGINSNDRLSNMTDEEYQKKQNEILLNRELFLEKKRKILAKTCKNSNTTNKNVRSKLMKRKRNTNSTSSYDNTNLNSKENSGSESNLNVSSGSNQNNHNQITSKNPHNNRITTESVDNSNNMNSNQVTKTTYNLRSKINKRPKFNHKNNKPNRVINQPMAKGLC